MGVLYQPFSIIARILGKRAGRTAFANLWAEVGDGERPPKSNAGHRSYPAVFLTAALEAAVLAGVGAVADQLVARVFHHLFGAWPGKPVQGADVPAQAADPVAAAV
jgi:hypothetical protein